MKRILILLFLLSLGLYGGSYEKLRDPRTGKPVRFAGSMLSDPPAVWVPVNPVFRKSDFRGVWIATIGNMDFPKSATAAEFQKNYLRLIRDLKAAGANAIIFQVRPKNDAFYPSSLNPWSSCMTGTAGKGYGNFDPMRFMIEEAHRNGLEFHAWLNPYRVAFNVTMSKKDFLNTLPANDFARKNPDAVLMVPSSARGYHLVLDPGNPKTIDFFVATVREIVRNYGVDAIHIDDYFYPYEPIGSLDHESYRKYNPRKLPLPDWRRNNIDTLIRRVGTEIRSENRRSRRSIRFGVSPFGIWANRSTSKYGSLTKGNESAVALYANTLLWIRNNWIDYVAPQIYWTFGHDKAAYAALASWWCWAVKGTKVKLYTGHSIARIGTNSEWSDPMEVYNQLRYNTMLPEIRGSIMFSGSRLFSGQNPQMRQGAAAVIRAWRKAAGIR